MPMPEYNPELCRQIHKQVDEKLLTLDKRISMHDESIATLSACNVKLTTLLANQPVQSANHQSDMDNTPSTFWDRESGKKLMNALIVLGFVIVSLLTGIRVTELLGSLIK